jgi:hypothetical protein
MKPYLLAAVSAAALLPLPAAAQAMPGMDHGQVAPTPAPSPSGAQPADHDMAGMNMQGMDMPGMDMSSMANGNAVPGSGTSLLPGAQGAMHGLHAMTSGWMLMAHGYALGGYTNQSGPRGDDGAVAGSMAMFAAEHDWSTGAKLAFHAMFSLDPVLGPRGYPDLFATGETAHGEPLVDRQHPHDFFMELTARLDVPLGAGVTGYLYGGPVGEPALGPSAFMMRRSSVYLPLAPIGHHWFDSTHISFGVVTGGVRTRTLQLEASGFRGQEPDEQRWDLETPWLDSWSLRATWTPSPHWAVEVSHGQITAPEAMHPGEDEARTIASVHYAGGGLSAMLGWSVKDRLPGPALSAWLAEANWDLSKHHSLFGRIENVANDELFPDHADPLHDQKFRVTRIEAGYAYRIPIGKLAELALGGSLAAYAKPEALDAAYGSPFGYTIFARLALGS